MHGPPHCRGPLQAGSDLLPEAPHRPRVVHAHHSQAEGNPSDPHRGLTHRRASRPRDARRWPSATDARRQACARRWARSATPTTTPWPRASSRPSNDPRDGSKPASFLVGPGLLGEPCIKGSDALIETLLALSHVGHETVHPWRDVQLGIGREGSNSRARLVGSMPARTRLTICRRNSAGYAGRVLGFGQTPHAKALSMSTKPVLAHFAWTALD